MSLHPWNPNKLSTFNNSLSRSYATMVQIWKGTQRIFKLEGLTLYPAHVSLIFPPDPPYP